MSEHSKLWSEFETDSVNASEIRQEIATLDEAAFEHYRLSQYNEVLALYRRAYQLSNSISDQELMAKYKCLEGGVLSLQGLYWEALAVFAQLEEIEYSPSCHWYGLICQIEIALDLPIPLKKIQDLIKRAYDDMRTYNLQASKSMLLCQESTLHFNRFEDMKALEKMKEALAVYDDYGDPRYDRSVFYCSIIMAYVEMEDRENAEIWSEKFYNDHSELTKTVELHAIDYKQRIALLNKDFEAALEFARQYMFSERETGGDCYYSLKMVSNAAIKAKKLKEARGYLAALFNMRHSECTAVKHVIWRLTGDYYTAMARLGGFKKAYHIKRAKCCYGKAMKWAVIVDNLLCCDGRIKIIQARIKELEAIED
jgi:tetratricopeptide (TPR) repeat protein